MTSVSISPARDVETIENGYRALSGAPWLAIETPNLAAGRIYELRYTCGVAQDVVRPLLRFVRRGETLGVVAMPAPFLGSGLWRGRIPNGVDALWINPVARPGPFFFAVEELRPASIATRLRYALASPKRAFFAASARMVGLDAEADLNLRWVYGRAETQDYRLFRGRRRRVAPTAAETDGPRVMVVVKGPGDTEGLEDTLQSLMRQTDPDWRVCSVDLASEATDLLSSRCADHIIRGCAAREGGDEIVVCLRPGDRLDEMAVACARAHFCREPSHTIAYADEIRASAGGLEPVFKPDWSPILHECRPYVGRAVFVREPGAAAACRAAASSEAWVNAALDRADAKAVGHIRRPLLQAPPTAFPAMAPRPALVRRRPPVGIVIPTRDRMDLLRPCLRSLFDQTDHPSFSVLVVDNGSVEPETIRELDRLTRDERRLCVLSAPGPFNFSALCNRGVAALDCENIVFLNNDTEVLQPDWLDRLSEFAGRPDIGPVGAKLLYPNRRVQHAGVVLGMGGVAGHFGDGLAESAEGWLGRNLVPHEVSAVTAACLMVSRAKFEAVGGFDEVNLPVDLNDVDLCLRLGARGWRAICDSRTVLLHRQSASRGGGAMRLQKVYQKERDYFLARWGASVRDDPYFNPNLSLYEYEPALG
ncbi:MAG: glycosyltransferase [Hyphomicrobiales bacterium]|nr:glycosyltransferase [Hyphomicrobiales bacterium]